MIKRLKDLESKSAQHVCCHNGWAISIQRPIRWANAVPKRTSHLQSAKSVRWLRCFRWVPQRSWNRCKQRPGASTKPGLPARWGTSVVDLGLELTWATRATWACCWNMVRLPWNDGWLNNFDTSTMVSVISLCIPIGWICFACGCGSRAPLHLAVNIPQMNKPVFVGMFRGSPTVHSPMLMLFFLIVIYPNDHYLSQTNVNDPL